MGFSLTKLDTRPQTFSHYGESSCEFLTGPLIVRAAGMNCGVFFYKYFWSDDFILLCGWLLLKGDVLCALCDFIGREQCGRDFWCHQETCSRDPRMVTHRSSAGLMSGLCLQPCLITSLLAPSALTRLCCVLSPARGSGLAGFCSSALEVRAKL